MSKHKSELFFWQVSRMVLTPLLILSFVLLYEVVTMTADTAVHTYHTYPYMFEHILCGVMLYLAFSLIIVKIHRSSLHDGRDSCQK